jgi:DnaJ-class molecular chaperone
MISAPTYYEILGIPEALHDGQGISVQTLKRAYHQALLQNHPDKLQLPARSSLSLQGKFYSVDQISEAFTTLSNSKMRTKYDKELKLRKATSRVAGQNIAQIFRTGVEVVDLDDLDFDETSGTWYKGCRCGDERGFLIREKNLEEAVEDGELGVGCRGCSLWLKVLFGIVENGIQDVVNA